MKSALRFAVGAVALLVVAAPGRLAAQAPADGAASVTVDEALAKRGKTLWQNRGCMACHTVGKGKLAGPDLAGVVNRRGLEWVQKWLVSTNEMLNTDPVGQEMLKEYKGVRMPNLKLTEQDANALINFIAQQEAKAKPR